MKALTKETFQVIKSNLKYIFLFELVYRLVTGPAYLQLMEQGLKFSLKMAGYSLLTAGNIGFFLIKPWTLVCIAVIGMIGLAFLCIEIGALITAFQGAAYYRRLNPFEMLAGGLVKLIDEFRRKNIKLLLLILVDYAITNLVLIYRVLTHVKPLNFVMSGLLEEPSTRLLVAVILVLFLAIAIPSVYTFHGCMVEQKSFRDAFSHSCQLLKGHLVHTSILMIGYNAAVIAVLLLIYGLCVVAAAIFVAVFTDKNLALAVLLAACGKIELVLIFLTSIVIAVVNFAAITVQYYQYSNRLNHEERWDFAYPVRRGFSRKMLVGTIAITAALSLFYIFDVVQNGSALTDGVLTETQITAHRGSSKTAPENTMASIRAAVEELADYAEIDVQETLDGVVVLCHDSSLKRVAGLNRSVKSLTHAQLLELDVGTWFSKDFVGEQIPTLAEVMEFCKGKINLNIEIKNEGSNSMLPGKVLELIKEHGMEEQCVVTSTNLSYVKEVKTMNPDIRTGYIISAAYGDYYSSDYIDFISLRASFVNEQLVEAAHEKGKGVHAWTVNTKSEMEQMKLLGVDNIITDYPVLAREIVYREEATENLLEYLRLVLK